MWAIPDFIAELYKTAKDLEERFLVNQIERDTKGKLTFVQYKNPLDENAEPEHIQEVDDAIKRALKMGWDPKDDTDVICRYSIFLWVCVESSYLHRRTDELQKGD